MRAGEAGEGPAVAGEAEVAAGVALEGLALLLEHEALHDNVLRHGLRA